MLSRVRFVAALLALFLAGPAVADDMSAGRRDAALVDIAALTAESDFTVFMRKDVPEDVRGAALRRLWVLMQLPVSCDELCDASEPIATSLALVGTEDLIVAGH